MWFLVRSSLNSHASLLHKVPLANVKTIKMYYFSPLFFISSTKALNQ